MLHQRHLVSASAKATPWRVLPKATEAAKAALGRGEDEASQSIEASAAHEQSRSAKDRGGATSPVGKGEGATASVEEGNLGTSG